MVLTLVGGPGSGLHLPGRTGELSLASTVSYYILAFEALPPD